MPIAVMVTGSFAANGLPVQGLVRFTPGRLWVIQDGVPWACLAPTVRLGYNGEFTAWVTPTDTDSILWPYIVDTPAGEYQVYIPTSPAGWSLRELIHAHRAGAWSTHR